MIDFKLDDLGWNRFEQLVQTLLKAKLGLGVEAWGGSGDWGRDAYFEGTLMYPTTEPLTGCFVFQCKFVVNANAAGAKPEKLILAAVRKECSRIRANLGSLNKWPKPPTCYALFTNACLSPKSRKSIDGHLKHVLPESKIGIHDGVDICQWLRVSPEVIGSFDELAEELPATIKVIKEVSDKVEAGPKKEIRAKLNLAGMLIQQQKQSESTRLLEEALALAQASKLAEEEVESLLTLSLYSFSRRGISNRKGYFDQAEKKINKIKDPDNRLLVFYFRAKAAVFHDERNLSGEEDTLRSALQCCENAKEDINRNFATQACVIRSELIILLCEQDRHSEAAELVTACDAYARGHANDADGELMQAAMSAGIFWALKSDNEADAIRRIQELEDVAKTANQAKRIGGQLSNMAVDSIKIGFQRFALAAAEAAVRLGQKLDDDKGFLVGALYTVAVMTFHSGDHAAAKRKAESLLDACNGPKDAIIKQAAMHLIAEISRGEGDSETAVSLATAALSSATGHPQEVAFLKLAVARALSDNGQTEEALTHAIEACELMKSSGAPPVELVDVLFQIVQYSAVLGRTADTTEALNAISLLKSDGHNSKHEKRIVEIKERAPKLAEVNMALRERIIKISLEDWEEPARPQLTSLEQSNAQVFKHLFSLWDEIPKEYLGSAATFYDFWGRGNFAKILNNAQSFPGSFNITLEVRTLDGIKQAIRLWSLYADMLLLIWKGPTKDTDLSGLGVLPETIFDGPGGAGYLVFPVEANNSKGYHLIGMTYASLLPEDVISFLMTEARPLLAAGHLVVVPANGVGCVHPGHGPLEQLLTETANAIAGLRRSNKSDEVPIGMMPYSPDAPFELLADIIQSQKMELRYLRSLLLKRTRELAPDTAGIVSSKELAMDIHNALSDLSDKQQASARKHGMTSIKEPMHGSFCRFNCNGSRMLPNSDASFSPLLTLQNFGYKWRVGSPGIQLQGRYEPGEKAIIGPWLSLPTEQFKIIAQKKQ